MKKSKPRKTKPFYWIVYAISCAEMGIKLTFPSECCIFETQKEAEFFRKLLYDEGQYPFVHIQRSQIGKLK